MRNTQPILLLTDGVLHLRDTKNLVLITAFDCRVTLLDALDVFLAYLVVLRCGNLFHFLLIAESVVVESSCISVDRVVLLVILWLMPDFELFIDDHA